MVARVSGHVALTEVGPAATDTMPTLASELVRGFERLEADVQTLLK
jgi:hypothetical protein